MGLLGGRYIFAALCPSFSHKASASVCSLSFEYNLRLAALSVQPDLENAVTMAVGLLVGSLKEL